MSEAHILAIPYPAQGHVIPLLELSHELVKHGIKVTFVNTDFVHNKIMKSLGEKSSELFVGNNNEIKLVSIPDGLEESDNRNDLGKLTLSMLEVMPKKLEMLIEDINNKSAENNRITCLVADGNIGWALEVAKKMGIKAVAFWPAAASMLALIFNIQKLLDDGIIDTDGNPINDETIQLSPKMPPMRTKDFVWSQLGDKTTEKILFHYYRQENNKSVKVAADKIICNTTYEHEAATLDFVPQIIPIGPLLATNSIAGNFWQEDSTCLNWLDQQETNSAFFIGYIRPDINNGENQSFLKEFEERVKNLGKVVQWAPQQRVLSHPSIACFISHCGWNSTMEGTTKGVPFLCWPYFADQLFNQTLIYDVRKVGLRLDPITGGIITREQITCKIKTLLQDEGFKVRAMELRNLVINNIKEGGRSSINLNNFVDWIKA
ncbi:hypothetical protein PIB30_079602 [Stylosanthes scabra]|uniref:Glycosyltransferase N-terminal domain-containing protein n=1 Tax=Stylosanthes scabra TaxID=79078 RepID=A0ABU6QSH0_9FABA|nr:hypothetical protein [Stylosanthes scabra]